MKFEQLNFRRNVTDIVELLKFVKDSLVVTLLMTGLFIITQDVATYLNYLFCDCCLNYAVRF